MLDELAELLNVLLEKDEAFDELIADEELFKEENELLVTIIDSLLEALDEAMLEAILELLMLANELEATSDKLLEELLLGMLMELDFE